MKIDYNYSSRIVLGTAQLGMNYGIANKTGKPDLATARDIVHTAWDGGIRYFDTAQAYGESEQVLGAVLSDLGIGNEVHIITKPSPDIDHGNKKNLEDALSQSLEDLKCDHIYGLMLHRETFLDLFETGLADTLKTFLRQGLVENIGVSLYSPIRAKAALEIPIISMIQVPANMCDHRFFEADIFDLAKKKSAMMFIRSVFLQGLLLMDIRKIPKVMQFAAPVIDKVEQLSQEFNLTREELALSYVRQKYPHAFVVVGAETKQQLASNLSAWKSEKSVLVTTRIDEIFSEVDERIINPTLWPH